MFNSVPDESWVSSVLGNVVLNLGGNWTLLKPKNRWVEVREGFKKSKWKFKMAFAMKGGGVSRGSRVPFTYFEK